MKITFIKSILAVLLVYNSFISVAQVSSAWVEKGPFGKTPYVFDNNMLTGNGIVNCVETDPVDPNMLYIGSAGGMWRSLDGGQNWTLFAGNKEFLNTVSVNNIVVSKTNRNVIFVSTGVTQGWGGCPTCGPDQNTSGIYRGVISGSTVTWQRISMGLPNINSIYTTGGTTDGNKGYKIKVLKQCPFDPNVLFAGTERGLYRCTNANDNTPVWQLINIDGVAVNIVQSIEYTKASVAGNYNLYVTGDKFAFKTSDLVNWTNLVGSCTNCLNFTGFFLTNLNTTTTTTDPITHNPITTINYATSVDSYTLIATPSKRHDNKMYFGLLTIGNGSTQRYLYSHDGNVWTKISEPHILWGDYRSGFRPIVASIYNPTLSPNEVVVLGSEVIDGAIENNIPLNGTGTYTTFYNDAYYTSGCADNHADIRCFKTSIDNTSIYSANDGFLSKFNPFNATLSDYSSWLPMQNNGVSLSTSYFISVSSASSDFFATGFMHNGGMFYKAGQGWKSFTGGDGLDQEFLGNDLYVNNNGGVTYLYSAPDYSSTIRYNINFDSEGNFYSLFGAGSGQEWQYRNIYKDPADPSKTYIMKYVGLYRISNGDMQNPTLLVDFSAAPYHIWGHPSALAVSNIDNNVMYAAFSEPAGWGGSPTIRYTSTAQTPLTAWQTLAIPADNAKDKIRSMAVSSANPNTLYVACTKSYMSSATTNPRARILVSKNGGVLTDYNNSRLSIDSRYEVHCILFENGSNEGVYAGTDNGVYYTNKTMTSWIRYDVGLPNIPVTEMVYHPKDNVILASTWGRGVWQVSPYCIPVANVTINTANFNSYKNTPTQVNGTMTFSANTVAQNTKFIYELRATDQISFPAGASFTANNTSRLLAYITPCSGGGSASNLRIAESSSDEDPFISDENISINDKMKIYPNPILDGKTKLDLVSYYDKQLTIVVYDVHGVEVKSIKNDLTEKEVEIDLNGKIPGMYIIKVFSGKEEVYTDKIIIVGTTEGDGDGFDVDTHTNPNSDTKSKNKRNEKR